MPIKPLPTPFGDLSPIAKLTAFDLQLMAYEIFVAACRTSAGNGSSGKDLASPGSKGKKAATIGELMRVQMRISETADSRVRRGLLRISAGQKRNLRMLEAGLLLHPCVPFSKSDVNPQRLRQIIRGALERPIETGRNNESLQVRRSVVMALASRSADGTHDSCHWADGFPLNLHLYEAFSEHETEHTESQVFYCFLNVKDKNGNM